MDIVIVFIAATCGVLSLVTSGSRRDGIRFGPLFPISILTGLSSLAWTSNKWFQLLFIVSLFFLSIRFLGLGRSLLQSFKLKIICLNLALFYR